MGWYWSLHIAQRMHEYRIAESGLSRSSRIVDRHPPGALVPGGVKHAVYVDNFCVISDSKAASSLCASKIRSQLESANLPTHENVDGEVELDFVGLHFDGNEHCVRLSWHRVWRLRLGLQHVLPLGRISGHQLERLIGHCTWAGPLRR